MKREKTRTRAEPISLALLENQCDIIEIRSPTEGQQFLTSLDFLITKFHLPTLVETSINEKVAYEVALTAGISSKRAAVVLDRNGLATAMDPLMGSAYTGVLGGFLIIVLDEKGSPIGGIEDSRTLGMFAKLPVLDPAFLEEARQMIREGFALSEKFQIPVMIRIHSGIDFEKGRPGTLSLHPWKRESSFIKDPQRWAATPRFRFILHKDLNRKLREIAAIFETRGEFLTTQAKRISQKDLGIISCGASYPTILSVLTRMGLEEQIPVLKVGMPHPLPKKRIEEFAAEFNRILIFENGLPTIEIQMDHRKKVMGKLNGAIPFGREGNQEDVALTLSSVMATSGVSPTRAGPGEKRTQTNEASGPMALPVYRHLIDRLSRAFPKAMITGDRTHHGLSLGLERFHCALDAGSSINLASGIYHSFRLDGGRPSIIAVTDSDSFFHSGISALVNAVYNTCRFILLILGGKGREEEITQIVQGCGIENCEEVSARNFDRLIKKMKEAFSRIGKRQETIAVLILD
jgi:indolepyruvate ferredoxin oxidoreductase alpha subunit